MATYPLQPGMHPASASCTDHVVGAILSGWRYDISGISPELRADYEDHLRECTHCRRRQRLHRTIDLLLFSLTALAFAAFLLASFLLHRLRALNHMETLHVHLVHEVAHSHLPTSITFSLQAVALMGVLVSMLLWVLVAIATPAPDMVTGLVREHMSADHRDRLSKQAA